MSVSVSSTIEEMQAERNALESFANDRARDFVGRQSVLARVTELCLSPARELSPTKEGAPWGICITGDPGSGKSALFGELLRRMKETDAFVLAHAVEATPRASSIDAMLRRWIVELGSALGAGDVDLADNIDPEIVEGAFASLLVRMASQRRVIILIDAIDQFKKTSRGKFTTWLPRLWPINARLVATGLAGGASKALTERSGVEALTLPPLEAPEAIIDAVCKRNQRKLASPVIDALLAKKHAGGSAWANPLWLMVALEELALLDTSDFADMQREYAGPPEERLQNAMLDAVGAMPTDILLLYRATFDSAAALLGPATAAAFIGLLSAGRTGWRESDFRQLLPQVSGEAWDQKRFAALRNSFRSQIQQHGDLAQLDFNHAQARAAARSRLAALRVSNPELHLLIADHLLTLAPDDPLRATETMVHLLASNDKVRAARYYGDPSLSEKELRGATHALADAIISPATGTPANAAREICRLLENPDNSVRAGVAERLLVNFDDVAGRHIPSDVRLIVLNAIEQTFQQLLRAESDNAGWQRNLSVAHDRVGDVLVAQGKLPEALKPFRDGLAIREQLTNAHPDNAGLQHDLSISHEKIGDLLAAQGKLDEALESIRKQLAIVERLANGAPGDADLQSELSLCYEKIGEGLMAQGNLPEALGAFQSQLEITERLARGADTDDNKWQRDRTLAYDRVGDVLLAQGKLPESLEFFRNGLTIKERVAKAHPDNTSWQRSLSISHDRIGDVLVAQGKLADALKSFRTGLEIAQQLVRTEPENVGWQRDLSVSHAKIGDVHVAQSSLSDALKSFHEGLTIRQRLANADPDNVDWQRGLAVSYDRIGDVLMAQDNMGDALQSFQDQFAIAERLARIDPGNAGWQRDLSVSYEKVGDVQMAQGNLPEALKSYRAGLAIRERLARNDPDNVNWQRSLSVSHDCIGDVLEAQSEPDEALKSFRAGLEIRKQLAQRDPDNIGWQRDLTVSYDRIGEVLEAQGNLEEAEKSFLEGLAIMERLSLADPGNVDLQRGVAVSQGHLAEMYRRSNDHNNALAALRQGQAAMERVVMRAPDNAGWKKDLDWFTEQIATLTD
ncbi:TPR repeat protein [Nitrobacter sp. Nb-311A]|uniref:ATP-binding protein n=1 Tax=unclassified Nitrobacter TaxID=2620411 RepID=UPI0000687094|nr:MULTISPECIES: ATP-binding protein [unclassified Nitrobacter]EAQ35809.1 TPR repeat protein [Nitrobacter sp. Nb-311A]MCV0386369.1 AAA family ATPase [Nitrobacter sp.]